MRRLDRATASRALSKFASADCWARSASFAFARPRARFDREAQRLLADPVRALVVEASWADLEQGRWRSDLTPAAALGSVLGWVALGLPVIMAGDHEAAGRFVSRLLYIAARRRWREARSLVGCVLRTVSGDS